ncbi:predicted protein [Streptomyces viridochromogenes DSM 40736]|uniref:Predicted protein n=1 Tax=Streptomyces viridochromogenes (strain DSM 40736 / JCM 4977 / BCRC 1201 / Tue 494) TaxID=591159 RepID=D9X6P8_STRVT|nr:DUF6415 family natural product biosynthesis protein [Streptomyces viridochromogenes]EFL31937.1 predicted protein [Streptomyces viridochromogenes DSM 40736]
MTSRKTTMDPPAELPQLAELPLDTATMRAAADRLLAEDAELPSQDELETLTLRLRGHLMLTIPEVEGLARQLPEEVQPRVSALAGVGEARTRLDLEPGSNLPAGVVHAQRLARSVLALCRHYENLTQTVAYVRMLEHGASCPDCRNMDENGEPTPPCPIMVALYEAYRQASRGPAAEPR